MQTKMSCIAPYVESILFLCIAPYVESILVLQIYKVLCTLAVDLADSIAEIPLFTITCQRNKIVVHYNLRKIQILSTWNQLKQMFNKMWLNLMNSVALHFSACSTQSSSQHMMNLPSENLQVCVSYRRRMVYILGTSTRISKHAKPLT